MPGLCPTVVGMRIGSLLLTVGVLLALAGCTPPGSPPSVSPTPSATAVFASDADALKAAEAAYAAYQAVSDQILIDGGADPERLKSVATNKVYESELQGFKETSAKGWHSTGGTTFDHFSLESYDPGRLGEIVVVYVCSDVSKVGVVDSQGTSVVSLSRPNRTAFEVTFALRGQNLVVSSNDVWTGGGVC